MAKRFIDTNIWDKGWFRKLEYKWKLFWIYILTKCDNAGIWDIDFEAASFFIGTPIKGSDIPEIIRKKMKKIDNDQLFIQSFLEFQHGSLSENVPPHKPIIARLRAKGLNRVLDTLLKPLKKKTILLKDKVIVKVKEKEKKKGLEKRSELFLKEVLKFKEEYPQETLDEFYNYWTEPNKSQTKMRFELQSTWDMARRLSSWTNNDKNWNKGNNNERKKMHFTNSGALYQRPISDTGDQGRE